MRALTPAEQLAVAVQTARSRGVFATAEDRAWFAQTGGASWEELWTPALLRLAHDALDSDVAVGLDRARLVSVTRPYLEVLWARTRAGRYRPDPLRRFVVSRGGRPREIGVPDVADQVLLSAWRLAFGRRIEERLADHVWGFRRGRDRFGAVRRLTRVDGARSLVRTDIRRMFESLDHQRLLGFTRAVVGEGIPLTLLRTWLAAWTPGVGVPTGISISPMLSNLYLAGTMDRSIVGLLASGTAAAAIRYADDFALLVDDGAAVVDRLARSAASAGLELHPGKTRIHDLACTADWPAVVLGVALRSVPAGRGFRLVADG